MNVPQHIAIILDGNGRWAKKKGMPRNYGHAQGSKNVERICEEAYKMGVKYLTVYAFSTENWNRPKGEVDALMKLLRNYMKTCLKTAEKNRMKVRVIGDLTGLDEDIRTRILELEEASKNNDGLNFQIAINYGSRDEIVRAVRTLAKDCKEGKIEAEKITEEVLESYLDTHGIPDPDLLIRTSGELRLSNYLLWQLAYTEFYFTDVLWPDLRRKNCERRLNNIIAVTDVLERQGRKIQMFKTRLISGILLVIVALFAIVSGGDILFGILLVLSLIGMSELYKIADVHKKLLGVTGYVAAAAYYILLHRVAAGKAPGAFVAGQINEITCIGILFLIVLMAVYVFSFPKYRSEQVMLTYFGMFYVAVMLSYIYQTRLLAQGHFS